MFLRAGSRELGWKSENEPKKQVRTNVKKFQILIHVLIFQLHDVPPPPTHISHLFHTLSRQICQSGEFELTAPPHPYFAEGEKNFGFFLYKRPFFFYREKGKWVNIAPPLFFRKIAERGGGAVNSNSPDTFCFYSSNLR